MQKNIGGKKETILVLEDAEFWFIVFSDLIDLSSVQLLTPNIRWNNIQGHILNKMCRVHHSVAVNQKIKLPLKSIWKRYDYVYRENIDVKRWIFTDTSIRGYEKTELEYLRRHGTKLHMVFLNPISSSYETKYAMNLVKHGFFDLVYTVDPVDAKKNGFIFTNAVYSKKDIALSGSRWRVSYIGAAKDRLPVLHEIARMLKDINSIFYITGVSDKDRNALPNVVYNCEMDYAKVLQVVNKSDCIVEVVQKEQHGFTFRVYEALCYNKKLITNNVDIVKQDFYDPEFIKVFTKIDKSLIDFINNKKKPDYKYKDQYSPRKLYEDILERE